MRYGYIPLLPSRFLLISNRKEHTGCCGCGQNAGRALNDGTPAEQAVLFQVAATRRAGTIECRLRRLVRRRCRSADRHPRARNKTFSRTSYLLFDSHCSRRTLASEHCVPKRARTWNRPYCDRCGQHGGRAGGAVAEQGDGCLNVCRNRGTCAGGSGAERGTKRTNMPHTCDADSGHSIFARVFLASEHHNVPGYAWRG